MPVTDAFRFQNDIKGAKLQVFEKLGHDPMEEDPDGHRCCRCRLPEADPGVTPSACRSTGSRLASAPDGVPGCWMH